MKIAIPVKMNNENPAIAPLFGKAKWFAIIENNQVTIIENEVHGGSAVIEWLNSIEVDTIIMQEMGDGPYQMVQRLGTMKIYHCGFDRITLNKVLEKFTHNSLELMDENGMAKIIEHHENKHPHHTGGGDHHQGDAHHNCSH